MNRYSSTAIALALTAALHAQPADPLSAELKTAYTRIKTNFIKAAEKMPEDQYDFKPTPDMQSFKERVAHIAVSTMGPCSGLKGTPKTIDPATLKTKAEGHLRDLRCSDRQPDRSRRGDHDHRTRRVPLEARAGLWTGRAYQRAVRLHLRVHAPQRNRASFERRTITLRHGPQSGRSK
jgi:hypothetical protein